MCIRDREKPYQISWFVLGELCRQAFISLHNLLAVSYTHLDEEEMKVEISYTFNAVSYTHLDVYKRQVKGA